MSIHAICPIDQQIVALRLLICDYDILFCDVVNDVLNDSPQARWVDLVVAVGQSEHRSHRWYCPSVPSQHSLALSPTIGREMIPIAN